MTMTKHHPQSYAAQAQNIEGRPHGPGVHPNHELAMPRQGTDLPDPQAYVDGSGTQARWERRHALQMALVKQCDELMKILDAIEGELPAVRTAINDENVEGPGEDIVAREFGKIEQEIGAALRRIMYLKFLCK